MKAVSGRPGSWDKVLAAMIDHTVLGTTATDADIGSACAAAKLYGFAALVVSPYNVPRVVKELKGSGVRTCSVVSFPFGAHSPESKLDQARGLLEVGAEELDMVMNVGAFLSGEINTVRKEIACVASLCKGRACFKLILETAYLDPAQLVLATEIGVEGGVDFVKTSTGFAPRGASVEDIRAMKRVVGDRVGIKAAGGIRTRQFALSLVREGATRIGCSASADVVSLDSPA